MWYKSGQESLLKLKGYFFLYFLIIFKIGIKNTLRIIFLVFSDLLIKSAKGGDIK